MKIVKYFLLCFLSISLSANAQNKKATNTLLWEISGKGLQKPSYLFGTYHFAGKSFIDTMKVLNQKLNNADAVVGELIMDSNMAIKLAPYMLMKNNFLDKLLSPDEYKMVADYLKKVSGYDLKMFNSMKPAAIQVMLLTFTSPITFSKDNPAIDQYFQDDAKSRNKKVLGLETVEDQAEVLLGGTLERQKELLLKSISKEEKTKAETQKIYDYYIAQDLGKFEKLFSQNEDYTQAEMDKLLKNRNQNWLTQLPALMQGQSLFIAVGAGHLIGKDGLIQGLKALGYTVTPLSTN
ncbi:TraB/GumN family protein [Pedobacter sp. KR3-3]|uniref:TraB/GumN family protein n=1 Tax=Pedobacter albus TaxID=3113905 RepID=A0ABU7I9I2_9SPHI|nr:TraB/GumN family protein [Pedobacter sp. KR3-3]MEE1946142.1 TraB/GumN family protein [Pedobacter sp. KR3-3]